jgi:hypothetical protein
MDVEEAVNRQLSTAPAVVALVADRVYPDEADQDAPLPLIVFSLIADETEKDLSGIVVDVRANFEVAVFATDKDQAKAIEAAVITAITGGAFAGADGGYLLDRQGERTDDGYESLLVFMVFQDGPTAAGG